MRDLVQGGHLCHGKAALWAKPLAHYHAGLRAGENTLNSQVARVVVRTMTAEGGCYNGAAFLRAYKDFMTTEGSNDDIYAEAFHRQFLANHLLHGMPLEQSAGAENHDTPSIGGFVALPPELLTAAVDGPEAALFAAQEHLNHTHMSERLATSAAVFARALFIVLGGGNLRSAAEEGAGL